MEPEFDQPIRVQKLLANAGLGSRRQIEELIEEKRILVNDKVAVLGDKALKSDNIFVDGQPVDLKVTYKTYLLNKPLGVISTSSDDRNRTTVVDLIDCEERIFPIGRLDAQTTGLILVSNDGDLTYKLTHPKFGVDKTYVAQLQGAIDEESINRLRQGVQLEDGITAPAKVKIIAIDTERSAVEIVIHEGRNRQIRRMAETVGYPVVSLTRTKIGSLEDKSLGSGEYRELTLSEIQSLKLVASSKNSSK